jgi:quercetin dioxygenase-like cupin family protein
MSESTGHEYLKENQISGGVLRLDLAGESMAILNAARKARVGHAAKTLVKDGPLRVVIIGFRAGATLEDHHAPGPVAIQAVSGTTRIEAAGESYNLDQGNVIVFGSDVSHSVSAADEAVLTIGWPGA